MKRLIYILLFVPFALFGQDNYSLNFDSISLALQSSFNPELLNDIIPISQTLLYENNLTDEVEYLLNPDKYYILNITGVATLCSGSGWCNWDALYEFHQDGNGFTRFDTPENKILHGKTRKLSMTIVLNEDYEEASKIRDLIRRLES